MESDKNHKVPGQLQFPCSVQVPNFKLNIDFMKHMKRKRSIDDERPVKMRVGNNRQVIPLSATPMFVPPTPIMVPKMLPLDPYSPATPPDAGRPTWPRQYGGARISHRQKKMKLLYELEIPVTDPDAFPTLASCSGSWQKYKDAASKMAQALQLEAEDKRREKERRAYGNVEKREDHMMVYGVTDGVVDWKPRSPPVPARPAHDGCAHGVKLRKSCVPSFTFMETHSYEELLRCRHSMAVVEGIRRKQTWKTGKNSWSKHTGESYLTWRRRGIRLRGTRTVVCVTNCDDQDDWVFEEKLPTFSGLPPSMQLDFRVPKVKDGDEDVGVALFPGLRWHGILVEGPYEKDFKW